MTQYRQRRLRRKPWEGCRYMTVLVMRDVVPQRRHFFSPEILLKICGLAGQEVAGLTAGRDCQSRAIHK